jgi:PPOX class probable F420-dependent enzyme
LPKVRGMTDLTDAGVQELLAAPNYAVLSSLNPDGTILSTIVWIDYVDGVLAVNSAVGRQWPTNLDREGKVTVLVTDSQNPYHFTEIRGTVSGSTEEGLAHINALAHKYVGSDYPWLSPGEVRKKFVITPTKVRYLKRS